MPKRKNEDFSSLNNKAKIQKENIKHSNLLPVNISDFKEAIKNNNQESKDLVKRFIAENSSAVKLELNYSNIQDNQIL
jgi:hypothetical protein